MLVLDIQVQPSAGQIHVAGTHAGRLKVRLTAPPARGRANEQLRQFLANEVGVPRTRVRLLTGARGRAKRVHVEAPRSDTHPGSRMRAMLRVRGKPGQRASPSALALCPGDQHGLRSPRVDAAFFVSARLRLHASIALIRLRAFSPSQLSVEPRCQRPFRPTRSAW